jgi:hypothetical protein
MADEILYEWRQVRVTDRIVTIGATTYPIDSISGVRLSIIRRQADGLFGFFKKRIFTARLFITLNTRMVHELAGEDIEEIQKLKAAIEEAFSRRK